MLAWARAQNQCAHMRYLIVTSEPWVESFVRLNDLAPSDDVTTTPDPKYTDTRGRTVVTPRMLPRRETASAHTVVLLCVPEHLRTEKLTERERTHHVRSFTPQAHPHREDLRAADPTAFARIHNREGLEPSQQLRRAIEGLPPAAERSFGDHVKREVNSLKPPNCKAGPRDQIQEVQMVPVHFHREVLQGESVWSFDGFLWADASDVKWAGGENHLPGFLRGHLGDRCVEVQVHHLEDGWATVTVFAS